MKKKFLSIFISFTMLFSLLVFFPFIEDKASASGIDNITARADYLYNIMWTCQKDVYGWRNKTLFKSGEKHRIPYGQPVTNGKYVCWGVSIDVFLNSTQDSSSDFYSKRSNYAGNSGSYSTYYAMDCSAFLSYCWDLSARRTTSDIENGINVSRTYIGACNSSNVSKIEVGDALNRVSSNSHVVLISRIERNSNGDIVAFEVTEQTPPEIKRSYYSPSELVSSYGTYTIYRNNNRDNVTPPPDAPLKKGYVMSESEGAGQTIPDGDYWILSALKREYWLDIPGDEISKNAENVAMWLRETNEMPSKYDAWTVTYLNNGYYKIKQKDSNLCLDVTDASLYAGTNVWLVNDNGAPAQQWSIVPTQTGYKLQSRCNSFVLDVSGGMIENGTNVQVWENNDQKTQRFGFIPYGTDEDRVIKDGTYKINSIISDAYSIDASGEAAKNEYKNDTNIQLWTNDNDDVFKIIYAGDGYYKIQEPVSGLYVEVINDGNPLNTQANIQLYEGNNSLGQYWKIRKNSNGTYTFTSKLSGYNLDLEDGKTEQGQNISQHFNNDATPQQWTLKPVGYVMSESEGAGQTIPDGDYWILSALKREYWLDIPGDEISKNAENVAMWLRETNEIPSKYDAWTVTYLNNGYYKIKQKDSNLCLDVTDASLYAGTNVWLVNDNGAPAQQWSIVPTQTGYKLQSRCNSFVLDVSGGMIENGTNVQVWENNDQKTQRFGFIPYGTDEDRVIKDGTYKINSIISDAYSLDASGEAAKNEYKKGTNIQLWTNDNDDVFKIVYAGDGYYKIQEPVSGLYVEVINGENNLNTQVNIQLYEGNNSLGQYWKIRKNSNGTYTFTSKLSGYNLDLEDGKTEQGQNISQHFNNDATPQQWTLKSLSSEIKGDCNADGEFSVADAVMLQKWLINDGTELTDWQAADLCEDGIINVFDFCMMKQLLVSQT